MITPAMRAGVNPAALQITPTFSGVIMQLARSSNELHDHGDMLEPPFLGRADTHEAPCLGRDHAVDELG
jgi:hypothetical protein